MTTTLERPVEPAPADPAPRRRRRPTRHHLLFGGLLTGTALLYLINLSASGWANQYYSAAAQAGSKSFTAFLFGSLDASNFITVDKPPASLWVMDASVWLFGVNSWAILVPQALMGVASVAVLYAAVRRVSGPDAGLLAGAALALTPVAALIFRYNNPDALLVLLMTAAAYATVRALEHARARWLVLAGALLGFAFLTKMLQGMLVVPAFALAYLVAAPTPLRKRLLHLLAAGGALVVSAGWWVALVELWPAGSRPYIGGSTDNSVLQLIFGYNGVGRLTGSDNNGSVGGGGTGGTTTGGTGGGFSSGSTGWGRLFDSEMGSQIAFLLPAALLATGVLVWATWGAPRTDRLRASTVLWGGWLLVTGVVFSFASGIIHAYYTVALAPAIAALVGIGVATLWRRRDELTSRWLLAGIVAITAVWTNALLGRASDWHPEIRWIVLLTSLAAVVLVLLGRRIRGWIVAGVLAVALLLGPAAYAVDTAATTHSGALPTAGPTTSAGFGPGGNGGGPGGGQRGPGGTGSSNQQGGQQGTAGGPPGGVGSQTGGSQTGGSQTGTAGGPGGMQGGGMQGGGMQGGAGGLGGASEVSSALTTALSSNADDYTWVAATTGANEASSLELATGDSVMALGGYNGTDSAITLAQFKALVAAGEIHYYVADGQGFIGSTDSTTSTAYAIQQWVTSNYTAKTVGGTTVYDLTA